MEAVRQRRFCPIFTVRGDVSASMHKQTPSALLGLKKSFTNNRFWLWIQPVVTGRNRPKAVIVSSLNGLGLWLRHAAHWQATNFTQIGAIWATSEALGRYALPGFGIRLIVLGCFLFTLVAAGASKIVVGAHCHDRVLRSLFGL